MRWFGRSQPEEPEDPFASRQTPAEGSLRRELAELREELFARLTRENDELLQRVGALERALEAVRAELAGLRAERGESSSSLTAGSASNAAEAVAPQIAGEPSPAQEPEPAPPAHPERRTAWETGRTLERALSAMLEDAPAGLVGPLTSGLEEAARLTREDTPTEELAAQTERLATLELPELVDLCEAGRRIDDPDLPFYRALDARLSALLEAVGLEEIRPAPGSPYRPEEQNALKVVRSADPSQRDQVDRCLSRGLRYRGRLLKKAEVVVYL